MSVLTIGLAVENLGTIPHDNLQFVKAAKEGCVIFPVGFTVTRPGQSLKNPGQQVKVTAEIRATDAGAPEFVITLEDDKENPMVSTSATGVWSTYLSKAKGGASVSVSGNKMYGLNEPMIQQKILELPGARGLAALAQGAKAAKAPSPQKKDTEGAAVAEKPKKPRGKKGEAAAAATAAPAEGVEADAAAAPVAAAAEDAEKPKPKRSRSAAKKVAAPASDAAVVEEVVASPGDSGSVQIVQTSDGAQKAPKRRKKEVKGGDGSEDVFIALPPVPKDVERKAKAYFDSDIAANPPAGLSQVRVRKYAAFLWQYTSQRTKLEMSQKKPLPKPAKAVAPADTPVTPAAT